MSFCERHILIISSWYPSAEHPFAGAFVREHALALAEAGHKVGVISLDFTEGESRYKTTKPDGFQVYQHFAHATTPNAKRLFWFLRYRAIEKKLLKHYIDNHGLPDVIHLEGLWPAGMLCGYLALLRRPIVLTEHSEEFLPQTSRRLLKSPFIRSRYLLPAAMNVAYITAPSRMLALALSDLGLADDVAVIPNVATPFNPTPFPTDEVKQFVHVSSFGPAKNIPLLLESIELLAQQRTDFRLVMVGDSEFRAQAQLLAHDKNLDPFISFVGYQNHNQLQSTYEQSIASVLSSRYETFSSFAVESLSAGRPVITTPCGGPQDFMRPETGVMLKSHTAQELARALAWMLDNYAQFDFAALNQYAQTHFSRQAVAAQFDQVYELVLAEHARREGEKSE